MERPNHCTWAAPRPRGQSLSHVSSCLLPILCRYLRNHASSPACPSSTLSNGMDSDRGQKTRGHLISSSLVTVHTWPRLLLRIFTLCSLFSIVLTTTHIPSSQAPPPLWKEISRHRLTLCLNAASPAYCPTMVSHCSGKMSPILVMAHRAHLL